MNHSLASQSDPAKWFNEQQWSMVESLMQPLRRRIMDLEGCLVHVKNFLPEPLKEHAESVLFPKEAP